VGACRSIADDYRGFTGAANPISARNTPHTLPRFLDELKSGRRGAAAFIAETLPSVAGPDRFSAGYLSEVYKHARAAGAVCIADEVQVGFGRLGTHFWGFETQGVCRTSPSSANRSATRSRSQPLSLPRKSQHHFANGMEFFSTFGGNPVACAAGLAVLEVLEENQLQQNALNVGSQWLRDLRSLQAQYPLIGDVRGMGFFLGIGSCHRS